MSELLQRALAEAASRLADRLPATYDLDPGAPLVDQDPSAHPMPPEAVTVRWVLNGGAGILVVSVPQDAADMLVSISDGAEALPAALTPRLGSVLEALATALGGETPAVDDGVEIAAGEALADGPGEPVSVALDDTGTHRGTLAVSLDPAMLADGSQEQVPDTAPGLAGGTPLTGPQSPTPGDAQVLGVPGGPHADPQVLAAQAHAAQMDMAPGQGPGDVPNVAAAGPGMVPGAGHPAGMGGRSAAVAPPGAQASPAAFSSFDQLGAIPGHPHPLALLGDVEMGVTAELGRTQMSVREVLNLTPGAIVELDRAAGSPVDVVVNGTLIARGEVVVIDEEFGIRITEIVGMDPGSAAAPVQVAQ